MEKPVRLRVFMVLLMLWVVACSLPPGQESRPLYMDPSLSIDERVIERAVP
jgi:hypothetical protein